MATWTPDGMLGRLFRILAEYSPPDAQVDLPVSWGDESILRKRLGPYVKDILIKREVVRFRSESPDHWVEFMRANFGPAIRAFAHSSAGDGMALAKEMRDLMSRHNRASNGTALGESEYLEVVATRL